MKKNKILALVAFSVFTMASCDIKITNTTGGIYTSEVSSSEGEESSGKAEDISSEDEVSSLSETSQEVSSEEVVSNPEMTSDPYEDVDIEEFYANYQPATSYIDSYYRSLHSLMSGIIDDQEDKPTISSVQPMEGDSYIRNSSTRYIYNTEGEAVGYKIVDYKGDVVETIYRGGGYVNLEEVAAYTYAFGEMTANHISSNKEKSILRSSWGKYSRGNFNYFSCDTDRYPNEPDLPDNYGGEIGDNNKKYYELDIGTTGTDTGDGYEVGDYNDGDDVIRGAARIVFTYQYSTDAHIEDPNERYVFYTYNHYSDFQEYLNYWGGWGKMFGKRYSTSDVYPTTVSQDF